jgi:hypothetical protein
VKIARDHRNALIPANQTQQGLYPSFLLPNFRNCCGKASGLSIKAPFVTEFRHESGVPAKRAPHRILVDCSMASKISVAFRLQENHVLGFLGLIAFFSSEIFVLNFEVPFISISL